MTPRCFGLPSLIHRDSPHCAECPYLNECERVALNKALALSAYIQIPDVIARLRNRDGQKGQPTAITGVSHITRTTSGEKVRMALTEEDVATVKQMPVKVRRKVELLMKQGKDVAAREALLRGENPFPFEGSGYMHVACELLLAGGFTRAQLRKEYMRRLHWTEGTAYSHVSAVVAISRAIGIAEEIGGKFVRKV
jgi:hypothetical protein